MVICGCICCILSVTIVRLFAYVVVVHIERDVIKWYPMLIFLNHLRRSSRKMINKYKLQVCLCNVPR